MPSASISAGATWGHGPVEDPSAARLHQGLAAARGELLGVGQGRGEDVRGVAGDDGQANGHRTGQGAAPDLVHAAYQLVAREELRLHSAVGAGPPRGQWESPGMSLKTASPSSSDSQWLTGHATTVATPTTSCTGTAPPCGSSWWKRESEELERLSPITQM